MPMIDSTAPTGSSRASSGSFDLRHEELPGDEGQHDDRDVDEEHRAVPEVPEQQPARHRADGAGAHAVAAQMPMALVRYLEQ